MLNNLGLAYGALGDHAKQRGVLERALAIDEREHGDDSTEVASVLNNLGSAYGKLGDHAKKRDMLERALAIKERAYGRDHAEVAITLFNLAVAHGSLGDNSKKRELLERALAIFEGAYGTDHPHTKWCQSELTGMSQFGPEATSAGGINLTTLIPESGPLIGPLLDCRRPGLGVMTKNYQAVSRQHGL